MKLGGGDGAVLGVEHQGLGHGGEPGGAFRKQIRIVGVDGRQFLKLARDGEERFGVESVATERLHGPFFPCLGVVAVRGENGRDV